MLRHKAPLTYNQGVPLISRPDYHQISDQTTELNKWGTPYIIKIVLFKTTADEPYIF